MKANKEKKLPKFKSLGELVHFFDAHDMGDYLKSMPEVHFDIDIKKKKRVFVMPEELAEKVTKIAHEKKIPAQSLVNLWLKEKVLGKA